VLALAVGSYLAYDNYSRRTRVMDMVKDASTRLDTLLQAESAERTDTDPAAHATILESYQSTLRRMDTRSFTPLADAADDYFVTAREIARRTADMRRARGALEKSLGALEAHIGSDRGAATWPAEAARLKQSVDRDVRDYRIAADAYRTLLESLPTSQGRVAPFVEGFRAIGEARVTRASATALDAYTAAENHVKRVADLGVYRRRR
jgi:hypothetical protein